MNKKIVILIVTAVAVLGVLVGLAFVGGGPMAPLETASPAVSESAAETPAAETADSAEEASEPETATGNIIFDGDNITLSGHGWGFETTKNGVTITKGGEYHVSGTANDAQILVDAKKDADVRLIFEGVDITYSQGAPINIQKAGSVMIELAEGTENFITDTENYVFEDGKDEPDAAIYSKADLAFMCDGSGSLTVTGNYDMAVHGKGFVSFNLGGTYNITAVGDGVKGKNEVGVHDVTLNITAGEDGIQANDKDRAVVVLLNSDVTITAGKDGINAVSDVTVYSGSVVIEAQSDGIQSDDTLTVEGGAIDITTGGGSENAPEHVEEFGFPGWFNDNSATTEDTASAKGLKSGGDLTISGGDITIDSMDDALHCAGTLSMSDGTVTIATGDDAFHSDDRLTISGGTIDITKSYEGLEGIFIEISGGDITLVASDDGLNAAGGDEEDFEFMGPGMNMVETLEEASYYIHITGGTLRVDAGGDGLDSNGALYIDGGEIYVSGPTSSADGALDYTTTGQINGGIVVAAGASGMAENFDSTSSQPSFRYVLTSYTTDECPITLTDSEGNVLVDVTMAKTFNSVVISTPDLKVGETYTLTCGLETAEVTLTDTITNIGSTGMGMGGPGMGGGRGGMGGMDMGGGPGGMMPPG